MFGSSLGFWSLDSSNNPQLGQPEIVPTSPNVTQDMKLLWFRTTDFIFISHHLISSLWQEGGGVETGLKLKSKLPDSRGHALITTSELAMKVESCSWSQNQIKQSINQRKSWKSKCEEKQVDRAAKGHKARVCKPSTGKWSIKGKNAPRRRH